MIDALLHSIRVGLASQSITGFMHDAVENGFWPRRLMWPELDAITRRDGEVYTDYIRRVKANPTARRVKLFDLIDNLTRGGGPSKSLRQRYLRAIYYLLEGSE